jgi:hypothetical protein
MAEAEIILAIVMGTIQFMVAAVPHLQPDRQQAVHHHRHLALSFRASRISYQVILVSSFKEY